MRSWREPILAHFTPELAAVSRLTIVSDPDQLCTEQGVLDGIREQGFELIPFDDHVAFRYAFESRYRESWDRGEDTKLVVVLRAGEPDVFDRWIISKFNSLVRDGKVITSRGPGTAMPFALTLAKWLVGEDKAGAVAAAMVTELPS